MDQLPNDVVKIVLVIPRKFCRVLRLVCQRWNNLLFEIKYALPPTTRPWTWTELGECPNKIRAPVGRFFKQEVVEKFWLSQNGYNLYPKHGWQLSWELVEKFGKTRIALRCFDFATPISRDEFDKLPFGHIDRSRFVNVAWIPFEWIVELEWYPIELCRLLRSRAVTEANILTWNLSLTKKIDIILCARMILSDAGFRQLITEKSLDNINGIFRKLFNNGYPLSERMVDEFVHLIESRTLQLRTNWSDEFRTKYFDKLNDYCQS